MKSLEQRIEHILRRMLADRAGGAPAEAIKWVKNLYRTRAVQQPDRLLQRIVAAVSIDLAPGKAAFGERSVGAGQARQVLFEAGENGVDLRITTANRVFEIRGQILGDGFENARIEFVAVDTKVMARADAMATFSMSGMSAGEYSLTIKGDAAEIFIERLKLK